ncbi:MAG: aminoglycoside 6-adenylyltransferase [Oscillospiraceae bacterium]|nr:aminoglycoside 6-adenylyltransferase [Oscillospiraceae bacterium]
MDRYSEIKQRLLSLAETSENLLAVIAIGSSARDYSKADEYSDLDLLLVCSNPASWLYGDLPMQLGKVKISFVEPAFGGGMERRILYSDSLDVDLIVLTPEQMENAFQNGAAPQVLSRGYAVLYDCIGISEILKRKLNILSPHRQMTEAEFINTVNDFWFHAVWSAKKILRGEMWTAKMCIDAYMKGLLLKIMELRSSGQVDVWHNGRFLEKWAGADTITALGGCFAHYDRSDLMAALRHTGKLYSDLARAAAQNWGFAYPMEAERYALSLLTDYLEEK